MIFHLSTSGAPVTWSVEAVYRDSYGIALNSAQSWYDKMLEDVEGVMRDSPQFVAELKEQNGTWAPVRSKLYMGQHHLRRPAHDERSWLLQTHQSPFPLDDGLAAVLTATLHAALVEFGYLLPRAIWEQRYPAQKLIASRFAEFNAADDAHRESGSRDPMPFEMRWVPFMECPTGFVFPYDVAQVDGEWRVISNEGVLTNIPTGSRDDTEARMRLLNSGWTPDEVEILMRDEAIG